MRSVHPDPEGPFDAAAREGSTPGPEILRGESSGGALRLTGAEEPEVRWGFGLERFSRVARGALKA